MLSIEPDSILKSSTLGTNKKLVQEDNSKNKILSQNLLLCKGIVRRNENTVTFKDVSYFCCPHVMSCCIFCRKNRFKCYLNHSLDPFKTDVFIS